MSRTLLIGSLCLAFPGLAFAEGTTELGQQQLANTTVVYVDILDSSSETITYVGLGSVDVSAPDGSSVGNFTSGAVITPTMDGAYSFEFRSALQEIWDLTVLGPEPLTGRVHAYAWDLDALSYDESSGFDGSFYILVDAGGPGFDGVIEMKAEGLAGYQWTMLANASGVDGMNGRSGPSITTTVAAQHPIYLNPPERAAYIISDPAVGELSLSGGVTDCDAIAPGVTTGTFTFDSNVDGAWRLICDINEDGVFDASSDDDLTLSGEASTGTNEVEWDGTDNGGKRVGAGQYECRVELTVGEFHFVADDIETSFEGLRMFELSSDGSRSALPMFWNDEAVQEDAKAMPNGDTSLVSSGPEGMDSGSYSASADPNVNARSWGDFTETSKGNIALLDTFTYLKSSISSSISVQIIDGSLDTDGDGIADIVELCDDGTDPYEVSGYYQGGCSTAPASQRSLMGLGLLALLGLALRRRRD